MDTPSSSAGNSPIAAASSPRRLPQMSEVPATASPPLAADALRRSQSTGDLHSASASRHSLHPQHSPSHPLERGERVRIPPTYRYSGSHPSTPEPASGTSGVHEREPSTAGTGSASGEGSSSGSRDGHSQARAMSLPAPLTLPPVLEHRDSGLGTPGNVIGVDLPYASQRQRHISMYHTALGFFGYGRNGSRARREMTLFVFNVSWAVVQVRVFINVFSQN